MEKVELSKEEFMELLARKPDYSGSEGNLYKVKSGIYKLYHNPYIYSDTRLEQIISFQPKMKRTKLPLGAIYFNSQFIGAILYPFEQAASFESLYHSELKNRIQKLRDLNQNLQELTTNGLVLEDLFYENLILDENGNVQIIDTDGDNIRLFQNKNQLNLLLKQFRTLILECSMPGSNEFDYEKLKHPAMNAKSLTYDMIEQLLTYLEASSAVKQFQKTIK